jgi:outer membrane protein insertion porin family
VRGYAPGSLGPTFPNQNTGLNQPTGGQSKIVTNVEYTFPVPGSGVDKTLRLFTFVDGGNVFNENINLSSAIFLWLGFIMDITAGPLEV